MAGKRLSPRDRERDRCNTGAIWCLLTSHVNCIITLSFSLSPGQVMSVIGVTQSVIGGSGHCWLSSGSVTQSTPCSPEYSLELWPESTHTHTVIIQTQRAFLSLEVLCQSKEFWEFDAALQMACLQCSKRVHAGIAQRQET